MMDQTQILPEISMLDAAKMIKNFVVNLGGSFGGKWVVKWW